MESFCIRIVLGLVALSLGHVSEAVNTETIFFRHYSGGSHRDVNVKQIAQLVPQLKPNKCTVFHIHGYTESCDKESATTVINAYLKATDCNVIAIDYRQIAGNINYIVDVLHVENVAKAIGNALNVMVEHGLNPNKIHIIGHSLGGQVSAHIGFYTNFVIPRITGLDPAGPMYYTGRYLKSGDAKFVVIIHTDAGLFGQIYSSGDVDFHPNGGHRPQPGCPLIAFGKSDERDCDHHRSWRYYAESVLNPNGFMAIQCTGIELFISGNCNRENVVPMGYATPTTARGNFYLHTNSQSPFAKGLQGI
ncbi:pancreatic lipase-related protein 3-like isoform X1 [Halictus rubicundus]|uniref:pancreatic lipase-related protein 3-like isoform X1 n=1 Tax=Halictus rubicundus TaxID=77578 RepID=UPI0040355DFB